MSIAKLYSSDNIHLRTKTTDHFDLVRYTRTKAFYNWIKLKAKWKENKISNFWSNIQHIHRYSSVERQRIHEKISFITRCISHCVTLLLLNRTVVAFCSVNWMEHYFSCVEFSKWHFQNGSKNCYRAHCIKTFELMQCFKKCCSKFSMNICKIDTRTEFKEINVEHS